MRDVAIKVLPPAFSGDSERLQRFEQEADGQRFLANLEAGNADTPITVVVNWQAALKK